MGNTQSVNVAKSVTDIFAKVSSEMIQQTELSTNNSQIISISNTGGDVTISGNTFTQTAYINMSALMDALANQSAVDKITAEMEQLAKSIVSGFNFFTFSDAKNTSDLLVKDTVNMLTQIKQSCAVSNNNIQAITVSGTRGSVMIQNNIFGQVSTIFSQCALKAISNNSIVQDIQERINQSATSELKGLNLVWLIILCAVIVIAPVFAATTTAGNVLKNIFPIVAVVGIVFIAVYFVTGKTSMKTYYYTKPWYETCTTVVKDASINENITNSVNTAIDTCLKSNSCQVVDVRLTEKNTTGQIQVKTNPQFNYFSSSCSSKQPEIQSEPATSFPKADVTAFKSKQRYQWLLYVGIAMIVGGGFGFLIQNRNLFRRSGGGSSGGGGESIEMSTFRESTL